MVVREAHIQSTTKKLDPEARPVAALAVNADDFPGLPWESDPANGTRVATVDVGGYRFALESEDVGSANQTTVYGLAAGEPLDQLIAALGLADTDVLDRVDHRREQLTGLGPRELSPERMAQTICAVQERLELVEARASELERERKEAAAALGLSGEELTERQRQTLSLIVGGWSPDEIAEVFRVSRGTVLKYRRDAIGRFLSDAGETPADAVSRLLAKVSETTAHESTRRGTPSHDARADLTRRELQVLELLAVGLSQPAIAERLLISPRTVGRHIEHILEKLPARSRAEAVAIAYQRGLAS